MTALIYVLLASNSVSFCREILRRKLLAMTALRGARSFPRRPDLARLDDVAGLVAPGVALIGDDCGDIGVGKLLAERRHRRAPLAVQHDLHLPPPWTVDERGAVERRERSFDPLPVRLMAGDAVRRVDPLAAGFQLGEIPFLVRIVCGGSDLLFLLADPGGVPFGREDLDHDRHEPVVLSAKLGALAAVDAFLFRPEPAVAHEAGNRVLLHAERRDHPGVYDVVGGEEHAHLLPHGHDHGVVHFEEIMLALERLARDLVLRSGELRKQRYSLTFALQVVVAPFPLIAGDLDGDVVA